MRFLKASSPLQLFRIKRLYREAFPKCERKPFSIIKAMASRGKTDLWYFEDDYGFVGMCATINGEDNVLLDYLAVTKSRRSHGLGSLMLKEMLDHYYEYGVFLEIEELDDRAPNSKERRRRREFYLRAGLKPMNTYVNLFGVNMELLGVRCRLDFDEYRSFYLNNYGRFAYDHILPRK